MFSGVVITTDGFGIFNSKEKQALIRRIGKDGLIILTDSDAGGKQIRSFLSGIIPKDKLHQLYIPRIKGKESRKARPSKEGVLGVEGVGGDVIRGLLMPFCEGESERAREEIKTADLYALGLTGSEKSASVRDAVGAMFGLPPGMNSKAFLAAINILISPSELKSAVSEIECDI
jgi:ribonuclease M5